MIKIRWLKNREIKVTYFVHLRIVTIRLYLFELLIDWGIKYRREKVDDLIKEQFGKICPICDYRLLVNSWGQQVKYHRPCRKYRGKKKYNKVELRRLIAKKYPQCLNN